MDKLIHILIIECGRPFSRSFIMETASMLACGLVLSVGIYGLTGLLFRRR
jgi:hypothetical protein